MMNIKTGERGELSSAEITEEVLDVLRRLGYYQMYVKSVTEDDYATKS